MGLFSKKGPAPKDSFLESEISASDAATAWKREYGHINFFDPHLKRFAPEKIGLWQKLFGGSEQSSAAPVQPPAAPQGPHDQFIDVVAPQATAPAPVAPPSVKRTALSTEMITRVVDRLKADGDLSMKQDTIQRLRTLTYRAAVDILHSHPDLTGLLQNKPEEFFTLPLYRHVSETYLKETAELAFGERAAEFLQNIEASGRFTPENLAHTASSRTIFTWLADEKEALVNANPKLLRKKAAQDSKRMRQLGEQIKGEFGSDHGVDTSIRDSVIPDHEKQTRPMPVPEDMHHHAASTPPAASAPVPLTPAAPAPVYHDTTPWLDTVPPEPPAFVAQPAHEVFHDSTPWEDTLSPPAEPAIHADTPAVVEPVIAAEPATPAPVEPATTPAVSEPVSPRIPPAATKNLPVLNEVLAEPPAAPAVPVVHADTPAVVEPIIPTEPAAAVQPQPAEAPVAPVAPAVAEVVEPVTPRVPPAATENIPVLNEVLAEPAAPAAAPVAAEAPAHAPVTGPAPRPPIMPSPAPEPVLVEPPTPPVEPPATPVLAPAEAPPAPAAAIPASAPPSVEPAAPVPAPAPIEPPVPAAAVPTPAAAAPIEPPAPAAPAAAPIIEPAVAAEAKTAEKIEAAVEAANSHKPNWLNRVKNPKLAAGAAGAIGAVGVGVWAWKEFVAKPDPNTLPQQHRQ